jgi:monoamine oxidase
MPLLHDDLSPGPSSRRRCWYNGAVKLETDVVVIGAGAAGLAAARTLCAAGVGVVVLEARTRIGGRLLTLEDPELPVPVDLGGEFVHGTAEASFGLLRAAGSVAIDTAGSSFAYEDGELREETDFREGVARVMRPASALHDDLSVDAFTRNFAPGDRRMALMMVEGFDAADPARASARAIAEEWNGDAEGQTSRQFRPLGGYGRLLRTLHGALDPRRVRVLLGTPVHAIRRGDGAVDVDATSAGDAPVAVRARAAIVTLPVGVLQSPVPAFEPPLPLVAHDALAQLVMGPVVKLVLRFRSAFWERLREGRYLDAGFFHRAGAHFPTFWTLLPLRTPVLVAWAGGPKADALAGLDEPGRVAAALDDLRALFEGADPAAELEAAYTHDWQADPYSRGAYSYVAVGGNGARAALAQPVDGLLFFAGEATAGASEAGTVAGALQSADRAAGQVLAALRSASSLRR